jgi:hypothetical protein
LFYNGFSKSDLSLFQDDVRKNIYQNMRSLLLACEKFNKPVTDENLQTTIELMKKEDFSENTYKGADIKELWKDKNIQEIFTKQRAFIQIYDSAEYFFEEIDRINEKNYVPTEKDLLMCRIKTIGITELTFEIDKKQFR